MNLQNKEFYSLNLDVNSVALSLQNARDKILATKVLQEKFLPEYDEKKKFYESVRVEFASIQSQWDNLELDIKNQEILVNAFTTFTNSKSENKRLQRMIDIKDKPKGPEKDMNVKWLQECVKVLLVTKIFMSWKELWDEFTKDAALIQRCNKNKTQFGHMKGIAIHGIMKHIGRDHRKRQSLQLLVLYNDKIGLPDWVDDNGIPVQVKIKEFMFAGSNDNGVH